MQQSEPGTRAGVPPLPAQRAPEAGTSADVLRSLGLDALVQIVESSAYGICVTGDEHRWVYLNPAGCRLVGRPFEQLQGEDYLLSFPEHERAALLALEQYQRAGDTDFYANTVVRPDGSQVGITWSGSVVAVDGRELAPAVFHPTHALHGPADEVAVPAARAGLPAGSPAEVLATLSRSAVEGTRAVASVVLVAGDEDGLLDVAAATGVPPGLPEAVRGARLRLEDLPGGELLSAGRVLLLSDDRARLAAAPATAVLARQVEPLAWEGSAKVPLARGGQVVGALVALLPPSVTAPTETELTFWSALGAHASVVLAEQRMREQAAELERQRLGRDLHDSVSAALFAVHARAQVVRRALEAGDPDLVALAAQDLEALSRQAIAELRSTVSGLRADPPGLADGLAPALAELARSCSTRTGLTIDVGAAPDLPALDPSVTEHLLRIATEALHNCAKHARARRADVRLEVRGSELVLTVTDDGVGFDPAAVPEGGHGQRTMRERAVLCGGWLHVDSGPGRGTRVVARVPLPG